MIPVATDVTDRNETSRDRSDAELLRAYVSENSEKAFQALVEKYLGMCLGVARRRTGNQDLAEEIAQSVFAILARKAPRLKATPTLAGWIYRVAMVECTATLRRERKRADKMKEYADHAQIAADGEEFWTAAQPHLDEAIDELPPADRDLLLMRYWETKSFREIAKNLGKSEAASQKQGERALEKLSRKLRRRGVAISIGALTAGLASNFATAAPPALVNTVTQGALTAAPALSSATLILKSIEAMTYAKTKTALAVAVVAAVPLGMQWNANHALQIRLDQLEAQVAAAPAPRPAKSQTVVTAPKVPVTSTLPPSNSPAATSHPELDPAAQLRRALNQSDPLKRSLAVSSLLANLDPDDAPSIAAVFDAAHQSGARYTKEHEMFMRAWGRVDGPGALQHAIDSSGDVSGSPPVLAAVAGWATADPQATRDWIEALEEGQEKEDLVVGLIDGWAIADHASASRYIESRPRTPARNRARQLLLERALMTGGIPGARDWFNSIDGETKQNKPYKQLAFDELNQRMLAHDPAAAADWIKEQDGQDFLRGRAIRNTTRKLAETSPADAIDLISSLESPRKGQLIGSYSDIINEWAQVDPGAAGEWLNQNHHHTQHDVMVNRYITTIADIEPETALQWAGTIDNSNRRRGSQMIAAAALLQEKGDAAIPTLEAAGLTPAMIKSAPNHAQLMKQLSGQERFAEQNLIIGESTVTIGAAPPREDPK